MATIEHVPLPQKEFIAEEKESFTFDSDESTDDYEFYDTSVTISDNKHEDLNNKSVYLFLIVQNMKLLLTQISRLDYYTSAIFFYYYYYYYYGNE